MNWKHFYCAGIVCLIATLSLGACKDKKEEQTGETQTVSKESRVDDSERAESQDEEFGDEEKTEEEDQSKDELADPFEDPDSLTGIPLCDRYLNVVCECAKKHPALKIACDNGKSSAPRWKESAVKDPSSKKIVEESCRKALAQVKENFGCE